jgi:hypothetical protein
MLGRDLVSYRSPATVFYHLTEKRRPLQVAQGHCAAIAKQHQAVQLEALTQASHHLLTVV